MDRRYWASSPAPARRTYRDGRTPPHAKLPRFESSMVNAIAELSCETAAFGSVNPGPMNPQFNTVSRSFPTSHSSKLSESWCPRGHRRR